MSLKRADFATRLFTVPAYADFETFWREWHESRSFVGGHNDCVILKSFGMSFHSRFCSLCGPIASSRLEQLYEESLDFSTTYETDHCQEFYSRLTQHVHRLNRFDSESPDKSQ